jgi:hypothetical protein
VGEAPVGGEHPALVAEHRCDRADGPGQVVGANRDQGSVVLDAISVDPPGEDVDSQQLVAAGVPPSPLAELVLVGRACDRGAHWWWRPTHDREGSPPRYGEAAGCVPADTLGSVGVARASPSRPRMAPGLITLVEEGVR